MKEVTIQSRQSVWDLANQEYGHPDGVSFLFLLNPDKINFQEDLIPGTKILIDETKIINRIVVNEWKSKQYRPCTAVPAGNIAFSSGFSKGFK